MREVTIGNARLILGDCRDHLDCLQQPNAPHVVIDPPYGIGEAAGKNKSRGNLAIAKDYGDHTWDNETVDSLTMAAIMNARSNIIVWGGNYYATKPSSCWLVWDKMNGSNDFADCELAWTNLPKAVRRLQFMWNGMLRQAGEPRGDHPTQKPLGLMRWCISHLPTDTRPVGDFFMGSGSTGVAASQMGRAFIGVECHEPYFDIACRRIEQAYRQRDLFVPEPAAPIQPARDLFA